MERRGQSTVIFTGLSSAIGPSFSFAMVNLL
jgi:hypothetical protein